MSLPPARLAWLDALRGPAALAVTAHHGGWTFVPAFYGLIDGLKELAPKARVVTDRATFAYLCDVFVCEIVRGQGAGKALVRAIMEHPELQLLRRWMLVTRDAHRLYEPYGFKVPENPERLMVRLDPDIYARMSSQEP